MPPTRLSLADDFGLELELAPDYVLARVDDVSNTIAAENRARGRRLTALLKEADALLAEPKPKKGSAEETAEETEARLAKADGIYDQARDVLLEVVASQTIVNGATPDLDELRTRLPSLAHAMWASNGLNNDVNLDPTRRTATS